jgi:hypothetical protein
MAALVLGSGRLAYSAVIRHGLPGDISLPDHATFVSAGIPASVPSGQTGMQWLYTVAGATPPQIARAYQRTLVENGWHVVMTSETTSTTGTVEGTHVYASKGKRYLEVSADVHADLGVTPPAGEVVLEIVQEQDP